MMVVLMCMAGEGFLPLHVIMAPAQVGFLPVQQFERFRSHACAKSVAFSFVGGPDGNRGRA